MTSHRRMIDNLCRQALDEGQAVTHREDLLAAEVRRLQAENGGINQAGPVADFLRVHTPDCAETTAGGRGHFCRRCSESFNDYVEWPCAPLWVVVGRGLEESK